MREHGAVVQTSVSRAKPAELSKRPRGPDRKADLLNVAFEPISDI